MTSRARSTPARRPSDGAKRPGSRAAAPRSRRSSATSSASHGEAVSASHADKPVAHAVVGSAIDHSYSDLSVLTSPARAPGIAPSGAVQIQRQTPIDLGDVDEWPENIPYEGPTYAPFPPPMPHVVPQDPVDLGLPPDIELGAGAVKAGADMAKTGADALKTIRGLLDPVLGEEGVGKDTLGWASPILDIVSKSTDVFTGKRGAGETFAEIAGSNLTSLIPDWSSSLKGGMFETAVSLANAGVKIFGDDVGIPKEVGEGLSTVGSMSAASMAGSLVSSASRGLYNVGEGVLTGEYSALDRQVSEMQEGKAGGPLQGYALLTEAISDFAATGDLTGSIERAGSIGQDSFLAKAGNFLGDTAFEFVNETIPEAQEASKSESAPTLWEFLGGGDRDEEVTSIWEHASTDLGKLFD